MPADKKLVSDLAKESLTQKWFVDSGHGIMSACPFCINARDRTDGITVACLVCACPATICTDAGEGGYVAVLADKYGHDGKISEICGEDLAHMIELFNKYIIVETSPKV